MYYFALLVGLAAPLAAHEIGTTQVQARFAGDGTYRVEIVVDPETLLARLEMLAGEPRSGELPAAEIARRVESRGPLFLDHVQVRFDAAEVRPEFRYLPLSDIPATAGAPRALTGRVRLEGTVPPGARSFRWGYEIPFGSYALTLTTEGDPQPTRQWLEAGTTSAPFPLRERARALSRGEVVRRYLELGFTHIVPLGLDHILFVLGIFLLGSRLSSVLAQVTAFTVAHSITLALTIYGFVSLSPRLVEPAIALSIVYVGIENVFIREVKPWRIALVFVFGLLHGMGFAGVLAELGLPRAEFVPALVAFNVGVELGQLAVILAAFLLVASWARRKPWYRRAVVVPLSLAIAATGLYWTLLRLAG